jgi:hypothetical protein
MARNADISMSAIPMATLNFLSEKKENLEPFDLMGLDGLLNVLLAIGMKTKIRRFMLLQAHSAMPY